jgi:hypothetical protein
MCPAPSTIRRVPLEISLPSIDRSRLNCSLINYLLGGLAFSFQASSCNGSALGVACSKVEMGSANGGVRCALGELSLLAFPPQMMVKVRLGDHGALLFSGSAGGG